MANPDPDNSKDVGTDDDDDILQEARERFAYVKDVDQHNIDAQREDTEFVYGEDAQWSEEARAKRKTWKLPCLQFNQLKQFVHQVVNDQRQGRPGIRVNPASGEASEKVAKLKQDLIRGIERNSDAESAYDTAFQHAVVGGRGYWRIRTDYESPKSFNRCIKIDRLPDPQSVRVDPDWQRADASDIGWGFVLSPMKKKEYQRVYKDAPLSWAPADGCEAWYSVDLETVTVADYYRLVRKERELVRVGNGMAVWADELPKDFPEAEIQDRRKATDVRCEWYTLAGGEKVIKRNPWRGRYVPIIVCLGDEIMVDGKRQIQGLIRHAKGPQVLLNAGLTEQVVTLSLTAKAPYVASIRAIKGHESQWKNANNEYYAYLPYNDIDPDTGESISAPARQQASMPDAGWINWTQQMIQQIRSTLGMYQNSIGQQGNETSGKAIIAREKQGDNATFHYLDNLRRAISHGGVVVDDLIPHNYDTERLVALEAPDGTQRLEKVNERLPGEVEAIINPDNDLTRGEYAVTVESGPSYATKREESRVTLVEIMQARPETAALLMDKFVRMTDMPDADVLAKRFFAMLPPQIQQMEQADKDGQDPEAQLQQAMGQLQQMQQQLQQAGQAVQQLQQENQQLQQGQQAKAAEAQARGQVDAAKVEADAEKAAADLQAKVQMKLLEVAGQIFAKQFEAANAPTAGVEGSEAETQPMMDLPTIMQVVQALADQISAAVMAPRQMQVQTDAMGNVVGGTSEVMA